MREIRTYGSEGEGLGNQSFLPLSVPFPKIGIDSRLWPQNNRSMAGIVRMQVNVIHLISHFFRKSPGHPHSDTGLRCS